MNTLSRQNICGTKHPWLCIGIPYFYLKLYILILTLATLAYIWSIVSLYPNWLGILNSYQAKYQKVNKIRSRVETQVYSPIKILDSALKTSSTFLYGQSACLTETRWSNLRLNQSKVYCRVSNYKAILIMHWPQWLGFLTSEASHDELRGIS